MLPAADLSGLLETILLLRSPRNAEWLLAARGRALKNETSPRSIEELREEVGLAGEVP
jgi:PHD/YefM family antitoxin component YafN of YafNO toxin-antitoxin module